MERSNLSRQRATGPSRSNVDSFGRAFRSRRIPGSRRWNQRMTDYEHEQEDEHEHEKRISRRPLAKTILGQE